MESRICMIRTGLIVFFITFLGILLSGPMDTTPYDRDDAYATDPCITYDSAKRLISIGCKSASLLNLVMNTGLKSYMLFSISFEYQIAVMYEYFHQVGLIAIFLGRISLKVHPT